MVKALSKDAGRLEAFVKRIGDPKYIPTYLEALAVREMLDKGSLKDKPPVCPCGWH